MFTSATVVEIGGETQGQGGKDMGKNGVAPNGVVAVGIRIVNFYIDF